MVKNIIIVGLFCWNYIAMDRHDLIYYCT